MDFFLFLTLMLAIIGSVYFAVRKIGWKKVIKSCLVLFLMLCFAAVLAFQIYSWNYYEEFFPEKIKLQRRIAEHSNAGCATIIWEISPQTAQEIEGKKISFFNGMTSSQKDSWPQTWKKTPLKPSKENMDYWRMMLHPQCTKGISKNLIDTFSAKMRTSDAYFAEYGHAALVVLPDEKLAALFLFEL